MSKYIKLERVELALGSMSMLDGKIFIEDALAKISSLPTIEVSEDCISVEDIGKTLNEWLEDKEVARFATKVLNLEAPRVVPQVPSEDCISRQDAIKALYKYGFVSKSVIEDEIRNAPSVVPISEKEIKR